MKKSSLFFAVLVTLQCNVAKSEQDVTTNIKVSAQPATKTKTSPIVPKSSNTIPFDSGPSDPTVGKRLSELHMQVFNVRPQQIEELIAIFQNSNDDNWNGAKYQTAQLLGQLRDEHAVAILTRNLMFLPKMTGFGRVLPTQEYYMCAVALTLIGNPSIRAMLSTIERADSEAERQLATWVIMQIEDKEQAIYRLQRAADAAPDTQSKKRYSDAVTYIKNFVLTMNYPGYSGNPYATPALPAPK